MKDYYETQRVKAGRSAYSCAFCRQPILVGSPSYVHKFYPEFSGKRTHPECSELFLSSEQCDECGNICQPDQLSDYKIPGVPEDEYYCCKRCAVERRGEFLSRDLSIGETEL